MLVLKTSSFIVASMVQLAPGLQQCCHRFAFIEASHEVASGHLS